MATPLVPVERAAMLALARHLVANIGSDITVADDWPNPNKPLFDSKIKNGAVTLLRAGDRQDELLAARVTDQLDVHDAISARIDPAIPAATDLPTAIVVVNAAVTSYEAHRVSTAAHQSADTTDVVTAPTATDLPTAIARANDLRVQYEAHRDAVAHQNPDDANAATAPAASDLPSLVALATELRILFARHYATRIYFWMVATCRQPVQLDVWAAFPVWRDDIQARLVPLLNVDTIAAQKPARDPTRNGVLVALADGWTGTADFLFTAPRVIQTADAQMRSEYRLMYSGTAEFLLTVRAQSARIAQIGLRARLAKTLPVPTGTPTSTADETADQTTLRP